MSSLGGVTSAVSAPDGHGAGHGPVVRQRADREVALLTKLVPILRPDQREKLAASIETLGVRGRGD